MALIDAFAKPISSPRRPLRREPALRQRAGARARPVGFPGPMPTGRSPELQALADHASSSSTIRRPAVRLAVRRRAPALAAAGRAAAAWGIPMVLAEWRFPSDLTAPPFRRGGGRGAHLRQRPHLMSAPCRARSCVFKQAAPTGRSPLDRFSSARTPRRFKAGEAAANACAPFPRASFGSSPGAVRLSYASPRPKRAVAALLFRGPALRRVRPAARPAPDHTDIVSSVPRVQ